MLKTKIKKILIKILLGTVLGFLLVSTVTPFISYAAGSCGEGFTDIEMDKKCENTDKNAACPAGWKKDDTVTDKTVCSKLPPSSNLEGSDLQANMTFLLWIQAALNRLIWPILVLIGGLMDNDLLFGSGMEEKLREIWINIRNLVNILFVIVLVGIALYNILGLGDEGGNYAIKTILPKIIIAIIAINFSFTAIKVFLDGINVLTVSIFALPDQVSDGLSNILPKAGESPESQEFIKDLCHSTSGLTIAQFESMGDAQFTAYAEDVIAVNIAQEMGLSGNDKNDIESKIQDKNKKQQFLAKFEAAKEEGKFCKNKSELSIQGEIFLKKYNSRNAAFAMALNMAKITFYGRIPAEGLQNYEKLAINVLFSTVFFLVFAASFVALFIVLLARLVVMWLSIALSPILILAIAEPTLKEKLGGFNKLAEQFTKMAIAPLIIALAMSVGWIMLKAIQGINSFSKSSALGSVGETFGFPIAGLSTLQDVTVALGTIGIVWLGVFGAAEGTIAEKATGFVKEWVGKAGKWLGTLPLKHTPFLPIQVPGAPPGEKYTAAEAMYALKEAFEEKPKSRLWEQIRGEKPVGPEALKERVKEPADLYSFIRAYRDNPDKFNDDDIIKNIEWLKRHKGREWWDKLDSKVHDNLDKLLDPANKDKRAEIIKDLMDNDPIKVATPMAPERTSATKPSAPSATGPVKPPTGTDNFGQDKKTISELIPEDGNRDAQLELYKQRLEKLGGQLDTLKQKNPDGTKVAKPDLDLATENTLKLVLANQRPTIDNLKTQLTGPKYDYLLQVLGNGDKNKGETALKEILGRPTATPSAEPPTAAPTTPPTESTTTPPAEPPTE